MLKIKLRILWIILSIGIVLLFIYFLIFFCSDELKGHKDSITSLSISANGDKLVSGSWDGTVKIWDIKNKKELKCFKHSSCGVQAVCLIPKTSLIISGEGAGDLLKIWDMKRNKEIKSIKIGPVENIEVSPSGKILYTKTGSFCMPYKGTQLYRLWKVEKDDDNILEEIISSQFKNITSFLGFMPDNTFAFITRKSKEAQYIIKIWDVKRNKKINNIQIDSISDSVLRGKVSIAPNGKFIAFLVNKDKILLYSVQPWKKVGELKKSEFYTMCWHPSSKWLVTGGKDGAVRLWSIKEEKQIKIIGFHRGEVESVLVSYQGDFVYSGGHKNYIEHMPSPNWNTVIKIFTMPNICAEPRNYGRSKDRHKSVRDQGL